jgi:NAD(P)H-nitrite reductase large subunit
MSMKTESEAGGLPGEHNQEEGNLMDTSSPLDKALLDTTLNRKKRPGYRCLGKQQDGNYAITVGAVTGTVNADQLTELANVVRKYGAGGHFTTAQSMVIVGITEADFEDAKRAVIEAGLDVRSIGRDVRQVKCCTGANLSPFGLQKTPPLAQQLERMFRGLPTPMKFKISVSGCPNCCANTMLNDFGVHGMMNGWKIFIGGKMGIQPAIAQEPARSVATADVSKYLASVLRVYKEKAAPDERLSRTLSRIGMDVFKSELETGLETPFSDLIEEAREAGGRAEESACIEHIQEA